MDKAMNDDNTYTCECCGGTFEKTISDAEALKEAEAKFGPIDPADFGFVCDICYHDVIEGGL